MPRNLKVLGLGITAVLAMSAVWAVSAQAAAPEFECTATTNTCTITGTGSEHTFNVIGGNFRCRVAFDATMNARRAANIASINASYTGCRVFGVNAPVSMNGCTYTFSQVAASSPATSNFNVVCPEGSSIRFEAPVLPCTMTIGAQNGVSHIVFENSAERTEPTDIVARFTLSGINYNYTGAGCPANGNFNGGTINGETTLEAFNDTTPGVEGNKVGLHVV